MEKYPVYKGTGANDDTILNLEKDAKLNAAREKLEQAGFIGPDADGTKYRFVNLQQIDAGHDAQVVIDRSLETLLPAAAVAGKAKQLVLTNTQGKRPDLVGTGTDWFFDRFVAARVKLNNRDRSAIESNAAINAFEPMMLTDVVPTTSTPGFWSNVCVCVDGSIVEMEVKSWGAMGFEVQVYDELTGPFWQMWSRFDSNSKDRYGSMGVTHFGQDQTIMIKGAAKLNIIGKEDVVRFQKVIIRTRRVTSYTLDGVTYESQSMPLIAGTFQAKDSISLLANHQAGESKELATRRDLVRAGEGNAKVVPGDSITPGGPTGGPKSNEPLSGKRVQSWKIDDWNHALGTIVIYFFVFKSEEAARKVIDGYNKPIPGLWD